MTTANKYEDFLSSYWSDLHSVAASKASDGGSSVGIKQSVETPREKAERLRKIIRFLSSMRSRCSMISLIFGPFDLIKLFIF